MLGERLRSQTKEKVGVFPFPQQSDSASNAVYLQHIPQLALLL